MGKKSRYITGFICVMPLALGLLIFRIYSFFENIYLSFTEFGALGQPEFIGLENYVNLFNDAGFWSALGNTFRLVLICIPLILIVSTASALLLNSKIRFKDGFRAIYFLPAIVLPVATMQVFMWLFNTDYGLINRLLSQMNLSTISWFSDYNAVIILMVMVIVYLNFSVPTFIFLGALQDIPKSYYEAADIDGASKLRQFFSITLPLMLPSVFYVVIVTSISLFQLFDVPFVMLPDGSRGLNVGKTMVYYYYENAFEFHNMRGYASALSVALVLVIVLYLLVIFFIQRRFNKQEG